MKKKQFFTFITLIFLALGIRIYGINWDQGFHLHPDERMLIMVAKRIQFFNQLNPRFFNYGSLPIYILKAVADLINKSDYQSILYVGRYLSIFFDIINLFFIYKIAFLLFKKQSIAFFSSFFYTIAFFPIQNSHFFISDVFLTSLTSIFVYLLIKFLNNSNKKTNSLKKIIFLGLTFAAMLSTKFTAIVFLPIVYFIIFINSYHQYSKKQFFIKTIINLLIFNFSSLVFHFIFMPYAFLDYKNFLSAISLQIKMNNNPYIFPYTLQYVNTLPYLYYLKNIFFWGLGPVISVLCLLGFIQVIKKVSNKIIWQNQKPLITSYQLLITVVFYLFYFLIIGRSAVKFMRYMLPVYPFLTIMAGYGLYQIQNSKFKIIKKTFNFLPVFLSFNFLLFLTLIWTLLFISIYSQAHTRISATDWILKNIPARSTLAIEHWDDHLPLYDQEKYRFVEMTLYDQPDDERKWQILNEKLKQADYIIIASNRLYVPLQKLNDCQKYKVCYPKTAEYYRKLLKEELGFKKVAEFAVYPRLKIRSLDIKINDQNADESFTVYDHPRIFIFKRSYTKKY